MWLATAVIVGVLVRAGLFWTGFAPLFGSRVEIVSPESEFRRVVEGVQLQRLGLSPYDGSEVHAPPLVLGIFSTFDSPLAQQALFVLNDLVIAWLLYAVACAHAAWPAHSLERRSDTELPSAKWLPRTVAIVHLLSPLAIVACVSQSTTLFMHTTLLASLYFALRRGGAALACFLVALAAYQSVHVLALAPAIVLVAQRTLAGRRWRLLLLGVLVAGFYVALEGVSYLLMGRSWSFVSSTVGFSLSVPDLRPNLGLHWYYFTEMFAEFRPFFTYALQVHVFVYALPVTYGYAHRPLFALWTLLTLVTTFKSFPTLVDVSLQLTLLLLLHAQLLARTRFVFVLATAFVFVAVLSPLFWHLWVSLGTGNANFFYAMSLVLAATQMVLFMDVASVVRRNDFLVAVREARRR